MNDIQVLTNEKGGVAKSSSVLNLAAEYAFIGCKTLIIDGDKQANITKTLLKQLNIDTDNLPQTLYDVFEGNKATPEKLILKTAYDNLWIIPSNIKMAEIITTPPLGSERALSRFLKKVWNDFEFVVIDTPPGLNIISSSALEVSTSALIPIQCEEYCLQNISQITRTIIKAQEVLNENLKLRGSFLTMVDDRLGFTKFAQQEAKSFFKEKLFNTYIRRSVVVTESQNAGTPLRYYAPQSKPAENYRDLAKEVLNRL